MLPFIKDIFAVVFFLSFVSIFSSLSSYESQKCDSFQFNVLLGCGNSVRNLHDWAKDKSYVSHWGGRFGSCQRFLYIFCSRTASCH